MTRTTLTMVRLINCQCKQEACSDVHRPSQCTRMSVGHLRLNVPPMDYLLCESCHLTYMAKTAALVDPKSAPSILASWSHAPVDWPVVDDAQDAQREIDEWLRRHA